jgi:hypothetical protein
MVEAIFSKKARRAGPSCNDELNMQTLIRYRAM